MTTKIPPYLIKGDTIAIICPAGYMNYEKVETCRQTLQDWGFNVRIGATVGSDSSTYFSGNDEERLRDFQDMLDDDSIHAILCARGGYGMGRIIDRVDFSGFKKHPKWIIGFSDITVLLSHIHSNYNIASLHGPMAAAFNDEGFLNEYVQSLRKALEGKKAKYIIDPHPFNRHGTAVGKLVGGNLSLLAHIIGSSSDSKTKGKILFLEDIGEYLYNIDRMMIQLKRSGKLDHLEGLIVGGFTDNKDTERPFGMTAEEIILDAVKEYKYPICFGFPVSHGKENVALKVGIGYKLKIGKTKVVLEE